MTAWHHSEAYVDDYAQLLRAVGSTPGVEPPTVAAFWPMVGHAYAGELMVVGRAVNGWMDEFVVTDLADPVRAWAAAEETRRRSEESGGCPLRWVTNAWGRPNGEYSTARSAFWRLVRAALASADPASATDPLWSSRLAWSNLVKVAPWGGGNPGGPLLELQRRRGPALLAEEVASLRPRRVLVTTGRWWFEPFADHLGLDLKPGAGLVEGIAEANGCRWVIAPHPQGKPRGLREDVVRALADG